MSARSVTHGGRGPLARELILNARLALAALALLVLPRAALAEAFVHDAADFGSRPVLAELRLLAGADWETTARQGGFGLRAGLDFGLLPRTRLDLWGSVSGGSSICVDGSGSSPFLGCYPLNVVALGATVHQGLVARRHLELGVEAGASVHNVPANSPIAGMREQAGLDLSLTAGRVQLFLRGLGGLAETPRTGELQRLALAGGGLELAFGGTRLALQLDVTHVDYGGVPPPETGVLLSLGSGFVLDGG